MSADGITFVVMGSGSFPVDMLRYDECYPSNTESVAGIVGRSEFSRGPSPTRTVKLISCKTGAPNLKRWQSFGWTVISIGGIEMVQSAVELRC